MLFVEVFWWPQTCVVVSSKVGCTLHDIDMWVGENMSLQEVSYEESNDVTRSHLEQMKGSEML